MAALAQKTTQWGAMLVRFFTRKAVFLAALLAGVAQQAMAVPVVSLDGPPQISLLEDGLEHDFTFTLRNNSSEPISGFFFDLLAGFPSGDFSDLPSVMNWAPGGATPCGTLLSGGASCTVILGLTPGDGSKDDPSTESPPDFGVVGLQLEVFFFGVSPNLATAQTTVTITDLASGAPEPATLALLSIGLAGLGFPRRIRKR